MSCTTNVLYYNSSSSCVDLRTRGVLDEDVIDILQGGERGAPGGLGLLCALLIGGVPPHELVVRQGAIGGGSRVAPAAARVGVPVGCPVEVRPRPVAPEDWPYLPAHGRLRAD